MEVFDVLGWLNFLIVSIINIVQAAYDAAWNLLGDFLLYSLDSYLNIVDWAVDLVSSIMPVIDAPQLWSAINADVMGLLGYIGFGTAIEMVVGALTIRFIMNFIPFVG